MRLELLIHVPLTKPLPSANKILGMHWAARASAIKAKRLQVATHLLVNGAVRVRDIRRAIDIYPETLVVCTLTRISPKRLDDDNLSGAFKAIRDEVAKQVCLDDGSPRWTWKYAQESGAPGYRIHLEVTQQEES